MHLWRLSRGLQQFRPHNASNRRDGHSSCPLIERKLSMLERYFVKPSTVDRIRASWIAPAIEQYVAWTE